MNSTESERAAFSAIKAQQEANRAARVRQLWSAAELWRQQQQALEALAHLRPPQPGATSGPPADPARTG